MFVLLLYCPVLSSFYCCIVLCCVRFIAVLSCKVELLVHYTIIQTVIFTNFFYRKRSVPMPGTEKARPLYADLPGGRNKNFVENTMTVIKLPTNGATHYFSIVTSYK